MRDRTDLPGTTAVGAIASHFGVRVAQSQTSLLDFLADRDLERATGSAWGSMTGLHRRTRINASLNAERNWL